MKTIVADPLFLFADSAMGRDAMPLFLPDGEWCADLRIALRIGRLGKAVKPKFALRYVDAISIVLIAAPLHCDAYPQWLAIMDSAVTTGRWIPVDPGVLPDSATAEIIYNDARAMATFDTLPQAAAQAIAKVTEIATIKTGDVIIPALPPISIPLQRDTRLNAAIGLPCLDLKIK